MIAPHQGKELELMLSGKKHLAVFSDVAMPHQLISEEIIPEKVFHPYVTSGQILRFSHDFLIPKDQSTIRFICFTTPDEEWRAKAFFWSKREGFLGRLPFDDAYEFFIGRLLGYEESDIAHFIEHQKNHKALKKAI